MFGTTSKRHARIIAAVATLAIPMGLVMSLPVAASASTKPAAMKAVLPPSASGCVGTLFTDSIKTCVIIYGSGSHVTSGGGTASANSGWGAETGFLNIHGAGGYDNNSPTESTTISYFPLQNVNVTPGSWCATFWQYISPGNFYSHGTACVNIS